MAEAADESIPGTGGILRGDLSGGKEGFPLLGHPQHSPGPQGYEDDGHARLEEYRGCVSDIVEGLDGHGRRRPPSGRG